MINLPKSPNSYSSPAWNQTNDSDVNGSIFTSFNLDLTENDKKLRLGRRLVANTLTSDIPTNIFGGTFPFNNYPIGFKQFNITNKTLWTVAGNYVFYQAEKYPNGSGFLQDTNSATPVDCDSKYSDIEIYNGELYVTSANTYISYLPAGASIWVQLAGAGGGSSVQPLCVFAGTLYVGAGSGTIKSIVSVPGVSHTVTTTGATTIAIPDVYQVITFLKAASDRIWIGTLGFNGTKGRVYEWDGSATQVLKTHILEAAGALSCVIKDDVPYIMDSNGVLSVWNGGTFIKLAKLYRRNKRMLFNAMAVDNSRFIHPNGMSIVNGKINLLIDGRNHDNTTGGILDSIDETIPSGIWEYDENIGLYHKHSIATAHVGDTIKDYGAVKLAGVGAIAEWNNITTPSAVTGRNGTLLIGANYFSDATPTVVSGIFYDDSNDTLQKSGYLVTPKLESIDADGQPSVQNMWQNFYTLYKYFLDSADKIYVKYRKQEISSVIATGTWTSTSTFTTPTDLSALTGYEVEILLGVGAGKASHITSAIFSSGSCTITVDEIYTGATGTFQIRVQNWHKISDMDTTSQATYDQANVGVLSNWIQFKVTMLFTGKDEIEKLIIINEDFNPAN